MTPRGGVLTSVAMHPSVSDAVATQPRTRFTFANPAVPPLIARLSSHDSRARARPGALYHSPGEPSRLSVFPRTARSAATILLVTSATLSKNSPEDLARDLVAPRSRDPHRVLKQGGFDEERFLALAATLRQGDATQRRNARNRVAGAVTAPKDEEPPPVLREPGSLEEQRLGATEATQRFVVLR